MAKLSVDCLLLIFNELTDEKNFLHSCLLVNKEWCNIVVPILWKKHSYTYLWLGIGEFNKSDKKFKKIINTILSCLPSSSNQLLSDNDIKLPSTIFLKAPLFNYISFCKFPNAETIHGIVNMVFGHNFNPENSKEKLLEQEVYKLFVSQCKNGKYLWWKTSQPLSLFPGASTCFSQLCTLCINIDIANSSTLYEMAQICKDLNELAIDNCY